LSLDYTKRSHSCGELTTANLETEVLLAGWVRQIRDLGGLIFIRIGDRYGETQVVFDPDHAPAALKIAGELHLEYVVSLRGRVRQRPNEQVRGDETTGAIEVLGDELEIISRSKPLPFPLTDEPISNEELRLKHRYLDLRRQPMAEMIEFRHRFMLIIRDYLSARGYLEIETPILTKSTPEGARDYLVPSRLYEGCFYALPQSPQMYKQMLMVAGAEKYFQIARCFRDEDARADRQAEFTQLDLELSFAGVEEVMEVSEGLFGKLWKELLGQELPTPWKRITFTEAMDRYGCDKPDTRFGLELTTLDDIFAGTELKFVNAALEVGGTVRGIVVPGQAAASRKTIKGWETVATSAGAGGLMWAKWAQEGFNASIKKFLTEDDIAKLRELSGAGEGDLLLLAAGTKSRVNTALARLRLHLGEELGLIDENRWDILWVTEFPQFEESEDGTITSSHHPFTMPLEADQHLIESDPLAVRSASYDIVLNGVELASGSPRIHDAALQKRIFAALGLSEETVQQRFGFFIEALSYGTPPHAGIAPGLDRTIALMLKRANIREIIAFPKTLKAWDPLTEAPSAVDEEQLDELHISVKKSKKNE